jgi:uncharacterized membrane protein
VSGHDFHDPPVMTTLIQPDDAWPIWALIISGVAVCIYLEQTRSWAAKVSGPVLALVGAMILSNLKILPTDSPSYDLVDNYLVPAAIPLLLFRANLRRILRDTGKMFAAFHVAAVGTLVGAFLAAFFFGHSIERAADVTGIMTGSYIGGAVNFMAVKTSFEVPSELSNPLIVADNFIMAGMFAVLLILSGQRFFLRHYPHPHTLNAGSQGKENQAATYWRRKNIALLDVAAALAVAFTVAAVSMKLADWIKGQIEVRLIQSILGNPFVLITFITVTLTTLFHDWMERIHGAEELGAFLLYLFFFIIGLRADLVAVLKNVPVLFLFCLVIAVTNLIVTLLLGRLLKLNLEELLLSVNATLGGAPSAAAMAISKGWSELVLPGLLAGIWGYVIGTFFGVMMAEILRSWL